MSGRPTRGSTYRESGVDIDAGEALVEAIKPLAARTRRPGADAALGGFGGLFDLAKAGYDDALLVAATDGVGTKLRIAIDTGRHDTIGIDLVAMCVNDLVVQGAEPLFFLDYFATAKLEAALARDVIAGIAAACRTAGCALIGGETAEMPDMYRAGDYDLAGFAVGAVERDALLPRADIAAGDIILGLASNGLHANGFSLVRRVVEDAGLGYGDAAPFDDGRSLGEALLEPTRLYVASCLAAHRAGAVKALAHITGGGLVGNVPRALPAGLGAEIDAASWPLPKVFAWLGEAGDIAEAEMARVFNCGIGMVAIVDPARAVAARDIFTAAGERVFEIGRVVARPGAATATVSGAEQAWR